MFKRLQRRLLMSNILILSILLLIVFGSLFGSIYTSVQRHIDDELEKIIVFNDFDISSPFPQQPPINDGFRLERTVSFSILLDENGTIVDRNSQFTADDGFFEDAYNLTETESGRFELEGSTWAYLKSDYSEGEIVAFLDISTEVEMLRSTITNYSLIFLGALIIVSVISYFLTRQSVQPIKDSMRKQQQFIADASHELKTPLTVINTNLEVIKSQDVYDQKWLDYIQNEVERMNNLTQKLLYLASVSEMEQDAVMKHRFDASERIESVLLGLDALAYDKQIQLTHSLQPNTTITFNKEQFTQVMMILLDNAIKYTNTEGTVHVSAEDKSNHILISVTNSGEGMTEEEQQQVFERFYKKDASRSENSNSYGLGLAIAKQIVENHHGKISVSSQNNQSTTFTIRVKK